MGTYRSFFSDRQEPVDTESTEDEPILGAYGRELLRTLPSPEAASLGAFVACRNARCQFSTIFASNTVILAYSRDAQTRAETGGGHCWLSFYFVSFGR